MVMEKEKAEWGQAHRAKGLTSLSPHFLFDAPKKKGSTLHQHHSSNASRHPGPAPGRVGRGRRAGAADDRGGRARGMFAHCLSFARRCAPISPPPFPSHCAGRDADASYTQPDAGVGASARSPKEGAPAFCGVSAKTSFLRSTFAASFATRPRPGGPPASLPHIPSPSTHIPSGTLAF